MDILLVKNAIWVNNAFIRDYITFIFEEFDYIIHLESECERRYIMEFEWLNKILNMQAKAGK